MTPSKLTERLSLLAKSYPGAIGVMTPMKDLCDIITLCETYRAALEKTIAALDTGGDCMTCCFDGYIYKAHDPDCTFIKLQSTLAEAEKLGEG